MPQILSTRQLNRTLLARQHLLARVEMSVPALTEHLIGLQSQIPNPAYIGAWTRLATFERDRLTQHIEQREIVRVAMMRSTLHLVTADDHNRFRSVIQPALEKALRSFFGKDAKRLDVDTLAEAARPFLLDEPRTTGELRDFLLTIDPDGEPNAMAYAVRTHLPLVQVPPAGTWGAGTRASYTVADDYVTSDAQASDLETLFRRYLRAYGPASIMDFQTWVGMTRLTKPLNAIKAQFTLYESEKGEVLFDLPEMNIIEADTPAPVRFIPEYDNILIAHRDRTRILTDDDYSKVFLSAARVLSTFLVDGVVAGTWKINRDKADAELVISPFRENDISSDTRDALVAEGEALLRFVEADADDYSVRFGAEERT